MRCAPPRARGGGWYVHRALRGNQTQARPARPPAAGATRTTAVARRLRFAAVVALLAGPAIGLAACGGGDEEPATAPQPSGTYRAEVVGAEFPTAQRLGQTSLMRLAVRNAGQRAIPALTATVTVAGREGRNSVLPFGFRNPQPDLAQPDRPVWVLAAGYPKRAGDPAPGGAQTSNQKTFNLGRLAPGETTEWVWKVSAVKAGAHTVLYRVGVGLTGSARAETPTGVAPGGSFAVRVSTNPPNTIVTDSGEVVPIPRRHQAQGAGAAGGSGGG